MAIILIGFMASGKSTTAQFIDPDAIDTDTIISSKFGMTTAEYFEKYGEEIFRLREEEVLGKYINFDKIISTGGGIVESVTNQRLLSSQSQVVYLKADFEILVRRIAADKRNRRSLFENSTVSEFRAIYDRRTSIYEELSTLTIDTTNKSIQEIASEILASFS